MLTRQLTRNVPGIYKLKLSIFFFFFVNPVENSEITIEFVGLKIRLDTDRACGDAEEFGG